MSSLVYCVIHFHLLRWIIRYFWWIFHFSLHFYYQFSASNLCTLICSYQISATQSRSSLSCRQNSSSSSCNSSYILVTHSSLFHWSGAVHQSICHSSWQVSRGGSSLTFSGTFFISPASLNNKIFQHVLELGKVIFFQFHFINTVLFHVGHAMQGISWVGFSLCVVNCMSNQLARCFFLCNCLLKRIVNRFFGRNIFSDSSE